MAAKLQLTLVNETEANNGSDIKVVPTKLHILAVDDNSIDRRLIEMLLKTSAYQVTAVDSAVRALEVLGLGDTCHQRNACPVNLIITDYRMPGMTGYDLLKKVKETSVLKEIPVVIMSSENSTARIKRCLAEGAEEFILKPVKIADVKRLRGHIRPPLNDFFVDQPSISNHAKRKVALEGVPKRTLKRRPRLEGVIIVP